MSALLVDDDELASWLVLVSVLVPALVELDDSASSVSPPLVADVAVVVVSGSAPVLDVVSLDSDELADDAGASLQPSDAHAASEIRRDWEEDIRRAGMSSCIAARLGCSRRPRAAAMLSSPA